MRGLPEGQGLLPEIPRPADFLTDLFVPEGSDSESDPEDERFPAPSEFSIRVPGLGLIRARIILRVLGDF